MPIIKTIARIRLLMEVLFADGTAESKLAVCVATYCPPENTPRLAGALKPVRELYSRTLLRGIVEMY
jgi:hypothetical protein